MIPKQQFLESGIIVIPKISGDYCRDATGGGTRRQIAAYQVSGLLISIAGNHSRHLTIVFARREKPRMREVLIRPISISDGEELVAANRRSQSMHHPWVHPFTDLDGFRSYLEEMDGERNVSLLAREMDTGSIVGVFTLSQIFRKGFQNAYLGFYGIQGQVGNGSMTAALNLTLGYAFDQLGLHRLEANIQPGNVRSIALVKRVGFRREGFSPKYLQIGGHWRDHERWAILAEEAHQ